MGKAVGRRGAVDWGQDGWPLDLANRPWSVGFENSTIAPAHGEQVIAVRTFRCGHPLIGAALARRSLVIKVTLGQVATVRTMNL